MAECARYLFALGGVDYEDHRCVRPKAIEVPCIYLHATDDTSLLPYSYPFSIVDGKYITGHTADKEAGVLALNGGCVSCLQLAETCSLFCSLLHLSQLRTNPLRGRCGGVWSKQGD